MSRDDLLAPFRAPLDLQIDYSRDLNPQQHAAVTAPPGPALVLAGAGAGKTRTLTYRVAFLLEQGIPAERILLLTFTNKAAREMMRRVSELLGQALPELWGGTFHAIGHRVLRRHIDLLGYRKDFTILDREDARDLVQACLREAQIDPRSADFPKADVVCDILSLAANTQKAVPEVVTQHYADFSLVIPQLVDLEQRYLARKRATNVLDFDDLLVLWLRLLEEQREVREYYQRKFQFVLVDEYQDTNRIQADLIDLLAARHHNVMVVGDDSQSIYSWRGANFQNILAFPKRHPEATIYKIETNYRSTPEILTVAHAAIQANAYQFNKELSPVRRGGMKPVLVQCRDARQQAAFLAHRLLELREEGANLRNLAVLYRSHFHALQLQLELTRRNIPFSITSGIRFFEQAHLKDAVAHLKLVCNPLDELAFKRVGRLLPGIGPKAADKLWPQFRSAWAASRTPTATETGSAEGIQPTPTSEGVPLAAALQACARAVPRKAAAGWAQLVITLSQLAAPALRGRPDELIRLLLEAGYDGYLKQTYSNYQSRREDLEELANFARQFQDLEDFLTQLALLSNTETDEDRPSTSADGQVRLSTIHQAKGLEFDVVFVIMLCDGLFPNARSLKRPEDEEEERRLFYVAITRARNELYLCRPLMRTSAEPAAEVMAPPSRFLREIPPELLDRWNLVSGGADP